MTVKNEDKRLKSLEDDPQSILNTNSAKMAEEEPEKKQSVAKPKMKSVLAILLVVVLLIGVFVGGGLISDAQYRAQLAKEEAQSMRDDAGVRYLDAPEAVDGSLESGITAMYYSQENGMWLTLTVINGLDKEAKITDVFVTLKNGDTDAVIVQGSSAPKKWSVAADETKEFAIYFPPEYVKITDDPLEKVGIEATVEHKTEN